MDSTYRRIGAFLAALALLGTGLWGYLVYARSRQEPPVGARLVLADASGLRRPAGREMGPWNG